MSSEISFLRLIKRAAFAAIIIAFFVVVNFFLNMYSNSPLSFNAETDAGVRPFTYRIIREYPHDSAAFTQGLVYQDGALYESTGQYGRSSLRRVDLETGQATRKIKLPENLFGEGLTAFQDRLIQLTWKAGRGLIYDMDSLTLIKEFHYGGEGWGLTHNGLNLIISDGSPSLKFLDPVDYHVVRRIEVKDNGVPLPRLNELEYINSMIWANVWMTDDIVIIDPESGKVRGRIDLTGLMGYSYRPPPGGVLNGIAYDNENDRVFVTGKYWPKLFEIEVKVKK